MMSIKNIHSGFAVTGLLVGLVIIAFVTFMVHYSFTYNFQDLEEPRIEENFVNGFSPTPTLKPKFTSLTPTPNDVPDVDIENLPDISPYLGNTISYKYEYIAMYFGGDDGGVTLKLSGDMYNYNTVFNINNQVPDMNDYLKILEDSGWQQFFNYQSYELAGLSADGPAPGTIFGLIGKDGDKVRAVVLNDSQMLRDDPDKPNGNSLFFISDIYTIDELIRLTEIQN